MRGISNIYINIGRSLRLTHRGELYERLKTPCSHGAKCGIDKLYCFFARRAGFDSIQFSNAFFNNANRSEIVMCSDDYVQVTFRSFGHVCMWTTQWFADSRYDLCVTRAPAASNLRALCGHAAIIPQARQRQQCRVLKVQRAGNGRPCIICSTVDL
jgi:hypothetical protein